MVEYKNPNIIILYYFVAYEVFCDRRIYSFGKSPHLVVLTTLKKKNLKAKEIYITNQIKPPNTGCTRET